MEAEVEILQAEIQRKTEDRDAMERHSIESEREARKYNESLKAELDKAWNKIKRLQASIGNLKGVGEDE